MARGIDVAIEARTSLGSVENKYPSNPTAPAKLLLVADLGEVEVREASIERRVPSAEPRRSTASSSAASAGAATASASAGAATAAASSATNDSNDADPELERILKMVEQGEISASEADELLQAMGRL
jgi:hypothetical protein